MIHTIGGLFCGLVLLLSVGDASPVPTPPDELSAPLVLDVEAAQRPETDRPSLAVVTLFNKSAHEPVTGVTLAIGMRGVQPAERPVGDLGPGQSSAEIFEVPTAGDSPYILAKYTWQNQQHATARAIIRPPVEKADGALTTLLPLLTGLMGIVGTLIGIYIGAQVTNRYTEKREAARAGFEWSKMLFERYEAAYRTFLYGWGASTDPNFLRARFDELKRSSLVPKGIKDLYTKTASVLTSSEPESKKEEASRALYSAVENFMTRPWYGDPP